MIQENAHAKKCFGKIKHTKKEVLPIYSLTPFTMLDFPGYTAAIIWFSGCNMRCGYCHNPQIVKGKGKLKINDILAFLEKRRGLLDGVVLSGGEVSVYPGIIDFIKTVKAMGYAVKLDTNGLRPNVIQTILEDKLVDYIALDYKAPEEKFKAVTGVSKFSKFEQTLDLLCGQSTTPFEIRTTVHTGLMSEADVIKIMDDLNGRRYKGNYYVQNFQSYNNAPTLRSLPPQKQELNLEILPSNTSFSTFFRNFN